MVAENLNDAELRSSLVEFLRESIDDGTPLSADTPLAEVGIDSFGLLELMLFVERRYGIKPPLELLTPGNTKSVATLSACCVEFSRTAATSSA